MYLVVFSLFGCFDALHAIDNPHFYRATYFWQEPRFEEPFLCTVDWYFGGGSAHTGRNSHGNRTSLLGIYGSQNMHDVGINVPTLDPTNPLDKILIDLYNLPSRPNFAHLALNGRFQIIEGMLFAYQNLAKGFFLQTHIPIRRLRINELEYKDLSPEVGVPNKNNPEWIAFLDNFNAILERYDLTFKPFEKAGFGDISFLVGWTCNYEETEVLDFVDATAKIGVLFPTGARRSRNEVISLSLGYNGHWGVPVLFDGSVGFWEWLTLGGHIGGLFFIEKTEDVRMKTFSTQNGFFMLSEGKAKVEMGTIWDISTYAKADHVFKGLSLLVGYTFTKQDPTTLSPKNLTIFPLAVVNSDSKLERWSMHTMHFMAEWDFTKQRSDIGPRIGFFYNLIVGGRRIFETGIKTSYIGVDISLCY
jgi:hypothetical protein